MGKRILQIATGALLAVVGIPAVVLFGWWYVPNYASMYEPPAIGPPVALQAGNYDLVVDQGNGDTVGDCQAVDRQGNPISITAANIRLPAPGMNGLWGVYHHPVIAGKLTVPSDGATLSCEPLSRVSVYHSPLIVRATARQVAAWASSITWGLAFALVLAWSLSASKKLIRILATGVVLGVVVTVAAVPVVLLVGQAAG